MINILILEDSSDMGGVQHSTLNFVKFLKNRKDVNFFIMLPGNGQLLEELILLDVFVIKLDERKRYSTAVSLFNDKIRVLNPFAFCINYIISKKIYYESLKKLNKRISM